MAMPAAKTPKISRHRLSNSSCYRTCSSSKLLHIFTTRITIQRSMMSSILLEQGGSPQQTLFKPPQCLIDHLIWASGTPKGHRRLMRNSREASARMRVQMPTWMLRMVLALHIRGRWPGLPIRAWPFSLQSAQLIEIVEWRWPLRVVVVVEKLRARYMELIMPIIICKPRWITERNKGVQMRIRE